MVLSADCILDFDFDAELSYLLNNTHPGAGAASNKSTSHSVIDLDVDAEVASMLDSNADSDGTVRKCFSAHAICDIFNVECKYLFLVQILVPFAHVHQEQISAYHIQ